MSAAHLSLHSWGSVEHLQEAADEFKFYVKHRQLTPNKYMAVLNIKAIKICFLVNF